MVRLLEHADVEKALDVDECLSVLEQAYRDLAQGLAVNRPRSHIFTPTADPRTFHLLKTIEGSLASLQVAVLRLNSELWQLPEGPDARIRKIPAVPDGRYTEFILLFDGANGQLLAILPDGHIQKMRVAMTHALAARYLARPHSEVLGLLGSGWQASAQAVVQARVHHLRQIKVFSPNPEHRTRFARRMADQLGIEVVAVDEPRHAVAGADLVVAATDSRAPVLRAEWLEKGMHLSSVRAWTEVERAAMERCDLVVVHNKTRPVNYVCGETIPPELVSKGGEALPTDGLPELAEVVAGRVQGRTSPQQVTLFVDGDQAGGPGIGIQFAAVAHAVYRRARQLGLGRELPLDWFLDREDHPYLRGSPSS